MARADAINIDGFSFLYTLALGEITPLCYTAECTLGNVDGIRVTTDLASPPNLLRFMGRNNAIVANGHHI